jgi:hypothetical protein
MTAPLGHVDAVKDFSPRVALSYGPPGMRSTDDRTIAFPANPVLSLDFHKTTYLCPPRPRRARLKASARSAPRDD